MGLLARILEPRSEIIENSADLDLFLRFGATNQSASGINVTAEQAMRVSTVYACVKILSEDVAKLPKKVFRCVGEDEKEAAKDHPLTRVLTVRPNPWQTPFEWFEMMQGHAALRGDAFSLITRVRGGVRDLIPLHPDRVTPEQKTDFTFEYVVQDQDRGIVGTFQQDRMFHLRCGKSPLAAGREAIGLAAATEKFGSQLFKNGAKMSGILKHPTFFSDKEVADRVKQSWDEATSGENAHKTALLEDGLEWQQVGMTADDAQFILTREHQIPEIARFFRMPLHKLQELRRATFSNIEQQAIEFVVDTLHPWLVRWEQAITRDLLGPVEAGRFFVEFNIDGLLRGDTEARNKALEIQRRNGIINANEWRRLERMNPRTDDGAEEYWRPLNFGEDETPDEPDPPPAALEPPPAAPLAPAPETPDE